MSQPCHTSEEKQRAPNATLARIVCGRALRCPRAHRTADGVDYTVAQLWGWLQPHQGTLKAIVAGTQPSWRHALYKSRHRRAPSRLSRAAGRGKLSTATWERISEILQRMELTLDTNYMMQVLLPEATILVHQALDPSLSTEAADEVVQSTKNTVSQLLRTLYTILKKKRSAKEPT